MSVQSAESALPDIAAITAERLPRAADPAAAVTLYLGPDPTACSWECGTCHHSEDDLPETHARLAASHHAATCGRTWEDLDEAYRDLLTRAAGARYLVQLPVGTTGAHVEIRATSALAALAWHCGNCGATAEREAPLAHAEAAVHAAHCASRRSDPLPAGYLDTLEHGAQSRITERVVEVLDPQREAAENLYVEHAMLRNQADQLTTERGTRQRVEGERDAARTGQERAQQLLTGLAVAVLIAVVIIAILR
jgi:hypothetical protein